MNGYFDSMNSNLTVHKGGYVEEFDDLVAISKAKKTHKFVLNFCTENINKERERIAQLDISDKLTRIKYVNNVSPYYYFQLTGPDGTIIEIISQYFPQSGEYDD